MGCQNKITSLQGDPISYYNLHKPTRVKASFHPRQQSTLGYRSGWSGVGWGAVRCGSCVTSIKWPEVEAAVGSANVRATSGLQAPTAITKTGLGILTTKPVHNGDIFQHQERLSTQDPLTCARARTHTPHHVLTQPVPCRKGLSIPQHMQEVPPGTPLPHPTQVLTS